METSLSRYGLNALNFFVAAVQTGFGPFISVYLTQAGWNQTDIGLALSVGTAAALISQLPGGWLVDLVHLKHNLTAVALAAISCSARALAFAPLGWIWGIEVVHSVASSVITPAIAAMTLSLCGHARYSERLGFNARFAAIGNGAAAALMGACAYYISQRAVFVTTAALVVPALVSLTMIRTADRLAPGTDHSSLLHPNDRDSRAWQVFHEPSLHVFAFCTALFGLSNAAMLPLALNTLTLRTGGDTGFVVSASIVVPQIVAALASPWVGRMAQTIGRRPVMLAGFVALPIRALLFATSPGPEALVAIEVLDRAGATVFGLMLPMIAADLTQRSGYLNTAIGALGLGMTLGAMASTTLTGFVSDRFGAAEAFVGLAAVGALGAVLLAVLMPETRPAVAAA
jgi:MFS family permease